MSKAASDLRPEVDPERQLALDQPSCATHAGAEETQTAGLGTGGGELLASDWRPRHASVSDVASTTDEARDEIDRQAQLALFDNVSALSAPTSQLAWDQRRTDTNGDRGPRAAEETNTVGALSHAGADRGALDALEEALAAARAAGDGRPAVAVLAASLGELGAPPSPAPAHGVLLRQAREEWLRRLEVQQKSQSTLVGYRVAIDDLLDWSEANGRDAHEEAAIVDYLQSYRERANPKPATYYRRFVLLRKFLRYVSRRHGVTDPFLDLGPPPKPCQESDWLTPEEFRRLLEAAGQPQRNLPGLAERDQLVLLALVLTGLRRSELCALDWRDLELDGRKPSLLVRSGKGGKSRRQPIATSLACQFQRLANAQNPEPTDPVFCGLQGGRLQQTILADIIGRAAKRAELQKHVTAHTLRHTAATWLRQELGDTRLVAEYLGHADLSTVARYAHVDGDELFEAAGRLEELAFPQDGSPAPPDVVSTRRTQRDEPSATGDGEDVASSEPERTSRRRRCRKRRRRR